MAIYPSIMSNYKKIKYQAQGVSPMDQPSKNETKLEKTLNDGRKNYKVYRIFQGIPLGHKRVLEIGCGTGEISTQIAISTNAREIVALDESAGHGSETGVLDILRKKIESYNLKNIEVVEQDFWKYEPDSKFDIILADNCLHHFVANGEDYFNDEKVRNDYVTLCNKIRTLLVDDGIFILKDLDPRFLLRFVYPKLYNHMDWDMHPPYKAWIDMLRSASFRNITSQAVVPYTLRKLYPPLKYKFWSPFLKGGVILYCHKS